MQSDMCGGLPLKEAADDKQPVKFAHRKLTEAASIRLKVFPAACRACDLRIFSTLNGAAASTRTVGFSIERAIIHASKEKQCLRSVEDWLTTSRQGRGNCQDDYDPIDQVVHGDGNSNRDFCVLRRQKLRMITVSRMFKVATCKSRELMTYAVKATLRARLLQISSASLGNSDRR